MVSHGIPAAPSDPVPRFSVPRFSPINHAAGPMPVSFTPGFQFEAVHGDHRAAEKMVVSPRGWCKVDLIYHYIYIYMYIYILYNIIIYVYNIISYYILYNITLYYIILYHILV